MANDLGKNDGGQHRSLIWLERLAILCYSCPPVRSSRSLLDCGAELVILRSNPVA